MGRRQRGPIGGYLSGELRAQKARHEWTAEGIAERAGVSVTTIDRATTAGDVSVVSFCEICKAMDLDPAELIAQAVGRSGDHSAVGGIAQTGNGEQHITVEGDIVTANAEQGTVTATGGGAKGAVED